MRDQGQQKLTLSLSLSLSLFSSLLSLSSLFSSPPPFFFFLFPFFFFFFSEPLSLFIEDYGTGVKSKAELLDIIKKNFDLRPGVLVKQLDLKKPIYNSTSKYGHFGRPGYTWETPKPLKF